VKENNAGKHRIVNLFPEINPNADTSLTGKFVIIAEDNRFNLVLGLLSEFPYHAHLVNRFCKLYDIPALWQKKPDQYQIMTDAYRINGGGWVDIKSKDKLLRVFGYSTAYGTFRKQDFLDIVEDNNWLVDYRIDIEQ